MAKGKDRATALRKCAESYWIFEDFASCHEKRKAFASVTTEAGKQLLVWTKDENVSAAKNRNK